MSSTHRNRLPDYCEYTLTPENGTGLPSLVTVNDFVGSLSSRTVAYLRILTDSDPVFVTEALNFSSSIELTLVAGPVTSTVMPSNLLKGLESTVPAKPRARSDRKNIFVAGEDSRAKDLVDYE